LTEHQVLNVASNGQTATVQVQHAGQMETLSFDGIVICAGVHGRGLAAQLGDRLNIYPVKGYSITVGLNDAASQAAAPQVSLLDDETKLVTSRLGADRFRVAGTAEFNGIDLNIRADRIKPLVNWAGKKANVFYNTGHGHLGWTLSAITAQHLAGHVLAWSHANLSPAAPTRLAQA
jgi:D-amino-acid dehydrogenase